MCETEIPRTEEEIKLLLIPADPQDDKNAILEIRGGTGGEEAAPLTPIRERRTMSSITCILSSSLIIAFPPYLITMILL